jgi:hypothetical protein
MTAPTAILELVERFRNNCDAYRSSQYNETQLRREFIDPFFEALGWDVNNTQGFAEAYKDVVHEDAIKIGGATKAPDYCFRIGGARKFFVEAKKPAVNLRDDMSSAFQLRRYAWSAKLSLSILTNFEEFAVYDCRIKPAHTDKASLARIFYFNHSDYTRQWDEIAAIFSREAVLKGSFDRFAEDTLGKKGTAEVDVAFLQEIEGWRDMLAQHIALRNPCLSPRDLNSAVQRTIDRIVFLRICEDRGVEEYGQLQALLNGSGIYSRLRQLFYSADKRYNSGLFHFEKEPGRTEAPDEISLSLAIDDKPIKEIIRNLYYPDSPYEFSVLAADILGQVYEQFLGKVIRLTAAHRAVVEEKPEVRKAGGVYYTPTYIVDYIVRNTVGKMLEGKTPKDFAGGGAKRATLRILDPACGSGSFLLGAFEYLLDWYCDWYINHDPKKWATGRSPRLFQGPGGGWRLTTAERKRILLDHIYGVDIDLQAVEVTKLSLLLKILEGESGEALTRQLALLHERALPDLGNNIKCGNSLIGPDFYENGQHDSLDEETRFRINALDWNVEFADILKQGGFDVVIGNPPYGAVFLPSSKTYLAGKFRTYLWRGESYLVFVETAHRMLRTGGTFGYIIPDTYLNLRFTKPIRDLLLQNTRILEIVILPSNVFQATTVDTTLLLTKKQHPAKSFHPGRVRINLFDKRTPIDCVADPNRSFLASARDWYETDCFLVHSGPQEVRILKKVDESCDLLGENADILYGIKAYQVGKGNPPQTRHICETKPFTAKKKGSREFLPFYDGKHIGRYQTFWRSNNWIKYGRWLAEPRNPTKFKGEKILARKIMGRTLIATYVPETSYCNTLLYVIKLKGRYASISKYVLGILNSSFIGWYIRNRLQISQEDVFPQILIKDLCQLPIPAAAPAHHNRMVTLVERMLALHQQLAAARGEHDRTLIERQIAATDKQIDQLVYELYELTDEEIRIVEEASPV